MLLCLFSCKGYHLLSIRCFRPTGIIVKSFIDHFTILFEEKRIQFDKMVLLGDFNISLNLNNDASNHFLKDFGRTQYVCEKTHRSVGILDHVIASNNISINVKSIASLLLRTIGYFLLAQECVTTQISTPVDV